MSLLLLRVWVVSHLISVKKTILTVIYEEFLDELNPELFALLNYQLEDHNALGTSLENYTQQVIEFVYIYRDNNTDKLTIHKEPTDLVSITNYGDMSLKLANTVLERPDAVELLNFY